jgi:large subunit ribosomal protein L17
MRKRKKGRKLSRKRDQRKALLRTMAASLFLKGKIRTTLAKAKELSKFAEKQVTRAKLANLAAQRKLYSFFPQAVVKKLVSEIAPIYKDRKGGYTRIIKLGPRKTDGAKMAIIELLK